MKNRSGLHNHQRTKRRPWFAAMVLILTLALVSCSTTTKQSTSTKVVASTSWVAAYVKAAGIEDVSIVAPANLAHPPDYDPKPSDLAAIAEADFVLTAGFDGFADRMKEASGSDAEIIVLDVTNKPENIRTQVRDLAQRFGTSDKAEDWIARFDKRIAELQGEIAAAKGDTNVTASAHVFMAYWVPWAGIELSGTYGPKPVSAAELAELTKADNDLIILNGHTQSGDVFADLAAKQVVIYNFPPEDKIDLIAVFERNAESFIQALQN